MKQSKFELRLTEQECQDLEWMINTHIKWGSGGCFGDGDTITDKKAFNRAKKLLAKIAKI